jgi:3-oxoacyl-[acyl-carrier-protein] synthase II
MLNADKVLVTVGTPCSISAVGTTETYLARVANSPNFIAHAAFDAGLVDFVGDELRWAASSERSGEKTSLAEIESKHGTQLRANLGIRSIRDRFPADIDLATDIAAPLPHDLEQGGLRKLAGITYRDIRDSEFKDMFGLFDDDPRLSPPMQTQLFVYAALGALAALPKPLRELVQDPYQFRVAAGMAFQGYDSFEQWIPPTANIPQSERVRDRFAMRLAGALASHGPALVSTLLSPAYSISRAIKVPGYLDSLASSMIGYKRVTQTPMISMGACASSSILFSEIAPHLLLDYPGYRRPQMVLWTAADAALQPDYALLDAFGTGAMMTQSKLAAINASRGPNEQRSIGECLAPFDIDANGTIVGHAGSGLLVTTLDFAMRNFLDITSIITGWGQSGEAGGKAHFAGVGFGGENAIVHALDMAHQGHGYGVNDFQYLVAHATGTRTNSKTDLNTAAAGRTGAANRQQLAASLNPMFVGTPKALGDGHSMGETGLKAVSQAIQYLLGHDSVGVPTLRNRDPDLGPAAEQFVLQAKNVTGNRNGGAVCATQGFGGYNGAIALRAANREAFGRYQIDSKVLSAYIERWSEIRRAREDSERTWRRRRKGSLELAQTHRWQGADQS